MRLRVTIPGPDLRKRARKLAVVSMWVVLSGGLAAAVFAMSFYVAMRVEMRSTEVKVPDLTGLTLEQASKQVEPLELVLDVVDQRHDPAMASGLVLQQTPPEHASVRRGRKVKLILSLGGKVLQVPDLIGHASRAVEIELRQGGFMPGDEARVHSVDFEVGRVVAQVPPPETPTVPNSRVHRLVSTGPRPTAWVMPDLVGMTRQQAERWISTSQFRRGAVRRVSISGRRPGTVVGQLPLSGYPIRSKDVVELTIAQ